MLMKTHLVIGIFAALFFLEQVSHKFAFIIVVLIASVLPDADSGFSTVGKNPLFRPLQFFVKHRGLLHNFTFSIFVSFLLVFYFPIIALPFFLGYSLHLFVDSLTVHGIKPFWPLKEVSKGRIKTGGVAEDTIFVIFAILDVLLAVFLFL